MDKGRKEKLGDGGTPSWCRKSRTLRVKSWSGLGLWQGVHAPTEYVRGGSCLLAISHRWRDDFFSAMPHLEVKMMHTLQESAQEDENKDQLR